MLAQERELRGEKTSRSETRLRLLAAAADEFAQRGFDSARVRHVVDQAKVNLAAVNYHFGGKEGLYRATIAHLVTGRQRARPAAAADDAVARTPEQRLEHRIFRLLEQFLDREGSALARILAHEAMNPSGHLDDVVVQALRPEIAYVGDRLREIAPDAPAETVELAAIGVLGQCFLYQYAQPALGRLNPALPAGEPLCRAVAAHIRAMVVAGVRATPKSSGESPACGISSVKPKGRAL